MNKCKKNNLKKNTLKKLKNDLIWKWNEERKNNWINEWKIKWRNSEEMN